MDILIKHKRVSLNLSDMCMLGVVFLPILDQYQFFSIRFMHIYGFVVMFCLLIVKKKITILYKFVPYIVYVIFMMILSAFNLSAVGPILLIKNIVSFFMLAYGMLMLMPMVFDAKRGYDLYTKIVAFISIVSILQYILNQFFSLRIPLIVPGLTLNYGNGMSSSEMISALISTPNYRVSSVFLEPAYHSAYVLPWLFLTLFNVNHIKRNTSRKFLILAITATIGCLLTTSMIGIVGVSVAWLIYFWKNIFSRKSFAYVLILPIFLAVGVYFFQLDAIQAQFLSKIHSLQDLTRPTSLSLRLIRGYYCFLELELVQKIFGCGYGMLYQFFIQNNIQTILDTSGIVITYMNGLSLLVCSVGLVGTVLYVVPMFMGIRKYLKLIPLLICWIMLQISAQSFDGPTYYLLMLYILRLSVLKKDIEIE